ncbi:MAG: hypothetical protein IKL90_05195 [Alphaproteobacteria bacterium]|nr:hypothetical protein [Alphaproteobacteria bacterium]
MKKFLFLILFSIGLAACADNYSNTSYSNYDIGAQGSVQMGRIVQMLPIKTTGSDGIGTATGAVAGAAAGSMLGGNTAINIIGGVGGALLGGMLGSATESAITSTNAFEFIIQKTNGSYVSLVQTNELGLRPGDNVWITTANGVTRIRSRVTTYY